MRQPWNVAFRLSADAPEPQVVAVVVAAVERAIVGVEQVAALDCSELAQVVEVARVAAAERVAVIARVAVAQAVAAAARVVVAAAPAAVAAVQAVVAAAQAVVVAAQAAVAVAQAAELVAQVGVADRRPVVPAGVEAELVRHIDKPDWDSTERAVAVHTAAVVDTAAERIAAAVVHTAAADVRTVAAVVDAIDPVVGSAVGHQGQVAAGRQHHLAEAQRSSLVAYWGVAAIAPEQSCAGLPLGDVAQTPDIRHGCIAAVDRWFPIRDPSGILPWWSAA